MDGPSPEEKRRTREFRDKKRADALAKAEASISDMESIFRSGGRLRKPHFRKLTKHLNASFIWSMDSRRALAQFLRGLGWSIVECVSEADIAIASDCGAHDVVVTGNSDSLIYSSIKTIWRPLGRGRYLVYDMPMLLKHLEISRTALTVLGIVCRNDYSSNLSRLGVSTNFKIILSLEKDVSFIDPSAMIGAYLTHRDVACKYPRQDQFDAPLKIFVRQEFSMDPTPSLQDPNYNDAQEINQRLKDLRLKLESNKKHFIGDQAEERLPVFNRYWTVDRPPERRPNPHDSGRKYTYRQRYAIKTRSQLKKHDPPESMKQYQLKPWKSPPESPLDSPMKSKPPKVTPKKPPREVATMDKKELVKAMQWDHPTRTLDIGTINANATRALNNGIDQTNADIYLSTIKASLRNVTRISSRVKRTAQRAIGQYIERLSVHNIDENDNNNTTKTTNTTDTTDSTSPTDSADSTNAADSPDSTNATGSTDSTNATGSSDSTNATDSPDSTNAADSPDSTNAADSPDSTNATDSPDSTNAADSSDSTNATDSTNTTKVLSEVDRILLDILCPAFSTKDLVECSKEEADQEPEKPEELEDVDESTDKKNEALSFLMSLLTAIHSARLPKQSGMGLHVRRFIEQAQDFLPAFTEGRSTEEYAGSSFLRSAALQLSVELKKHYRNGAIDLRNKIEVLKRKKLLPPETRDYIAPQRSAIENFILLNRACGGRRSLVPMSNFDVKFITLSELDLSKIFWQNLPLRHLLQSYAHADFPSIQYSDQVTQSDVGFWLSTAMPGLLITRLLTDIGRYSEAQRKKLKNYSRSTFLMPLEEMRDHLLRIRDKDFVPANYTEKGYVLRGSIRTDGFRLQVLAFKLNELHSVKYRRFPAEKLPCRLTTTLGGTDYFLTEIRNLVSTKQDVTRLWGNDPESVKILGIDLGQAFVVGASAILPPRKKPNVKQDQEPDGAAMESLLSSVVAEENEESKNPSPKFFNLAVKQKAVYQGTFKHRRWLERRKGQSVEGRPSISHIETSLPPYRGPEASVSNYIQRERELEGDLESFYDNVVMKKHKWNARKARAEEYRLIADRLLQLVGGSTGVKKNKDDKVVIGVGLGKFSSKTRLSSLHESFQSYFVQK
ncbi:hypothetical protein BGZ97_003517, partial [Linnemannia gamsii]